MSRRLRPYPSSANIVPAPSPINNRSPAIMRFIFASPFPSPLDASLKFDPWRTASTVWKHPCQIQVARHLSPIHFFTRAPRWSAGRPPPGHYTARREKRHRSIPAFMEGQRGNVTERYEVPSKEERGITSGSITIGKINSANFSPIFDRDHKLQSRPDIRHCANFYVHQAGIESTLANRVSVDVSHNARAFLRPRNPEHACRCQ